MTVHKANQELVLLLDDQARKLLLESEIDLERELLDRSGGVDSVRSRPSPLSTGGTRDLVPVIVLAASAPILAVGASVVAIIRALHSKPQLVTSRFVQVSSDGNVTSIEEQRVAQTTDSGSLSASVTALGIEINVQQS